MTGDEWVNKAMTDETLVVKLLMQLKHSQPEKLYLANRNDHTVLSSPPLEWSVRNRRSKHVMTRIACEADVKGEESTRVSPTTPLSWSGGTSVCGGAAIDGGEESSRQLNRSEPARSKVISPSEATTKRPRKKKTLVELKEEEGLLLKEKKDLQDELASLRFTVEKQKTTNQSLKRMKFDIQFQSATKKVTTSPEFEHAISSQHQQQEANGDAGNPNSHTNISFNNPSEGHHSRSCQSSKFQKKVENKEKLALLPDLNLPAEEISNSDFYCAIG